MDAGWSRTEIDNMTIGELKTFIAVATKKAAEKQIQFIIGTAIGAQGDKKGIDKSIEQLKAVAKDSQE